MSTTFDFGILRIPDYDALGNRVGETVFVRHPVFDGKYKILNDVYFRADLLFMTSPADFERWALFIENNAEEIIDISPDKILIWNLNVSNIVPKIGAKCSYAIIF